MLLSVQLVIFRQKVKDKVKDLSFPACYEKTDWEKNRYLLQLVIVPCFGSSWYRKKQYLLCYLHRQADTLESLLAFSSVWASVHLSNISFVWQVTFVLWDTCNLWASTVWTKSHEEICVVKIVNATWLVDIVLSTISSSTTVIHHIAFLHVHMLSWTTSY